MGRLTLGTPGTDQSPKHCCSVGNITVARWDTWSRPLSTGKGCSLWNARRKPRAMPRHASTL